MKIRSGVHALLAMLALGAVASEVAHADVVGVPNYSPGTLYDSTTLATGPSMNVATLNVSAPGTLTVKLQDLGWPDKLSALSFALTSATGIIGAQTGEGTFTYQLDHAGTLFASIFAVGGGDMKTGLYNVNINLAPVPLPAAIWLLGSGIAGFAALRRKSSDQRLAVTSAA